MNREERIAHFHPEVQAVWEDCDIEGFGVCVWCVLSVPPLLWCEWPKFRRMMVTWKLVLLGNVDLLGPTCYSPQSLLLCLVLQRHVCPPVSVICPYWFVFA